MLTLSTGSFTWEPIPSRKTPQVEDQRPVEDNSSEFSVLARPMCHRFGQSLDQRSPGQLMPAIWSEVSVTFLPGGPGFPEPTCTAHVPKDSSELL